MGAHHKNVDNAENILNEFLKYLLIRLSIIPIQNISW